MPLPASPLPPTAYSQQPTASPHRGLTLIEMLVALAVTLVMMAAVVNLFANISGSIRNRRAVIEVSGQLRQVRQQLALDLAGATCTGRTWQRAEHNPGYIEIIEGPWSDLFPSILVDGDLPPTASNPEIDYATSQIPSGGDATTNLADPAKFRAPAVPLTQRPPQPGDVTNGRALGDWDDVLALTVQSEANPFRVQVGGNMVESNYAEVVWFAGENNPSVAPVSPPQIVGMRRIYRRVFIIDPRLGPWDYIPGDADLGRPANVSVHFVPGASANTGQWVANHLSDLSKRENRAARNAAVDVSTGFPYLLNRDLLFAPDGQMRNYLVFDDALAFDVRVYDPGAPLFPHAPRNRQPLPQDSIVQPGDPGWIYAATEYEARGNPPAPAVKAPAGYGAYCDLGWNWDSATNTLLVPLTTGQPSSFAGARRAGWHPTFASIGPPQPLTGFPAVYDTWSFHYENNGVGEENLLVDFANQAGLSPAPTFATWQTETVDQATNSLDDDLFNGVNDPGERETSPPYDVPLRGVRVSLRIYERDARQIRETSVTHAFDQ